jgi:hypothetical protein
MRYSPCSFRARLKVPWSQDAKVRSWGPSVQDAQASIRKTSSKWVTKKTK